MEVYTFPYTWWSRRFYIKYVYVYIKHRAAV